MAKVKKVKTPPVEIETTEEFRDKVNRCGVLHAQSEKLKAQKKARVAQLGKLFDDKVALVETELDSLMIQCEAYARAHGDEVFKPGTKSGETEAVEYNIHKNPDAVKPLPKIGGLKEVVQRIIKHGKDWAEALFLHKDPELSKEAVKAALAVHEERQANPAAREGQFALSPAQLVELGLYLEQSETFEVKVKGENN